MSCLTVCNAQTLLPINGSSVSYSPTGAIDLVFSGANQSFLLSDIISWNKGDSYTINFREPAPTTEIHIGDDVIPKGITSFQGFNPPCKHIHWIASNGEKFEESYAWLKIISDSPAKLHISEVIINRKDGSKFRCYYPNPQSNNQFVSKQIHWEAKNGEEHEEFLEISAQLNKAEIFSGKITFTSPNSYIGGAEWVGLTGSRPQYRLKLYNPTTSDNFAWKYVTKSGETRYQKIEKNASVSTFSIDEEITKCYIAHEGNGNDILEIQEISITESTQTNSEILVLWHRNGSTTEISLYAKPRITFSTDKLNVQGTEISLEFPIDDIIKFTYKKEETQSVIEIPREKMGVIRDGERITFNGIKSLDQVSLYNMNGIRIPIRPYHTADGNVSLSLYSIPTGIYLIRVNGLTYKIMKR